MFLETHCRFELNFMIPWDMVSDKVIVVTVQLVESQSFKRFFSPSRLLQQKTMITVENDIVAGDILLCLRGRGSIGNGRQFFELFCFRKARQRIAAIRTGSKMGCVELSNFHFCCAAIFCQPMKKFEFFGATRATRQRHSKTSSTGDEDGAE